MKKKSPSLLACQRTSQPNQPNLKQKLISSSPTRDEWVRDPYFGLVHCSTNNVFPGGPRLGSFHFLSPFLLRVNPRCAKMSNKTFNYSKGITGAQQNTIFSLAAAAVVLLCVQTNLLLWRRQSKSDNAQPEVLVWFVGLVVLCWGEEKEFKSFGPPAPGWLPWDPSEIVVYTPNKNTFLWHFWKRKEDVNAAAFGAVQFSAKGLSAFPR